VQTQSIEDRVTAFLDRKFRYSKSYATRQTYKLAMNKFGEFLRTRHDIDINQLINACEAKTLDPISILDEFFTFLTQYKLRNGTELGDFIFLVRHLLMILQPVTYHMFSH